MLFIILIVFILVFITCYVYFHFYSKKIEQYDDGSTDIQIGDFNVYVLNLDRAKDRLESFIETYMQSDLKYKQFTRVSAVDGKKLVLKDHVSERALKEIEDANKQGFRVRHYSLTAGAVGCALTHMKTYELVASSEMPYGLIFEDDVLIDQNIFEKMNAVLRTIPSDWDILLLGCFCVACDKYTTYYNTNRFFLLHGYLIKKESAEKILLSLQNKKIEQQIDSELSDLVEQDYLKIYCLRTGLAQQGNFKTSIQLPIKITSGINPYSTVDQTV